MPSPLLAPDAALAQNQPAGAPDQPMKQIALTEAQIQSYIAAAADIEPMLEKIPQSDWAKSTPKS